MGLWGLCACEHGNVAVKADEAEEDLSEGSDSTEDKEYSEDSNGND